MTDMTDRLIIETPDREIRVRLRESMTAADIYHALHCQAVVVMTPAQRGQQTIARAVLPGDYGGQLHTDWLEFHAFEGVRDIILPGEEPKPEAEPKVLMNMKDYEQEEFLHDMGIVKFPPSLSPKKSESKVKVPGPCVGCGAAIWKDYRHCKMCGHPVE